MASIHCIDVYFFLDIQWQLAGVLYENVSVFKDIHMVARAVRVEEFHYISLITVCLANALCPQMLQHLVLSSILIALEDMSVIFIKAALSV